MGLRTRNPPPPIGELSLTYYDDAVWADARVGASEWQIDLGLYVEYALKHYARRRHSIRRFQRWRHEQDMKDPDMRAIKEFLDENDPQPEPEYMKEMYLPKRKQRELAEQRAKESAKPKRTRPRRA